jgi:ComF family protein
MPSRIKKAFLDALAVLSPVECAGCSEPDVALCDDCGLQLEPAVTPRTLEDGSTVYTALRYEGVVRHTVLAFKEGGRTDVAKPLGRCLAAAIIRAAQPDAEFLLVPTSREAWRRRGYDPIGLLCRKAGYRYAKLLLHNRTTVSQKTLGIEERTKNLHGSISSRRSLDGRKFVLLDDVVTTGATFVEAARAVTAAGGEVVGRAALAFTPRQFGAS